MKLEKSTRRSYHKALERTICRTNSSLLFKNFKITLIVYVCVRTCECAYHSMHVIRGHLWEAGLLANVFLCLMSHLPGYHYVLRQGSHICAGWPHSLVDGFCHIKKNLTLSLC